MRKSRVGETVFPVVLKSVMKRFGQSRIIRFILGSAIGISLLLYPIPFAHASCRDPDVVRGFGSLAYAANVDATIQYFGHNFFLITTSKGTRIVADPLGPGWYPNPNVAADVVTVGKEMYNHNAVQIVQGNPLVLRGLKNYGADWNLINTSVKDTFIYSVPIHQNADSSRGFTAPHSSMTSDSCASPTWAT